MGCTCSPPLAVTAEHARLDELGGTFLGSCGDENHTYGFHLPPCRLPDDDYSLQYGEGPQDKSAAGDFGMDWPQSRQWLASLIVALRAGKFAGVCEVIGSLDGVLVLYWARWNGWRTEKYTGQGHDTWTHVSFDRTKTDIDWKILEVQVTLEAMLKEDVVPNIPQRPDFPANPKVQYGFYLQDLWQQTYKANAAVADLTKIVVALAAKLDQVSPPAVAGSFPATLTGTLTVTTE